MHEPDFLLFASDSTLMGLAGGVLLLIALVAVFAERRRLRRKAIDDVGWVPWMTIYVLAAFAGLVFLAIGLKGWTSPG